MSFLDAAAPVWPVFVGGPKDGDPLPPLPTDLTTYAVETLRGTDAPAIMARRVRYYSRRSMILFGETWHVWTPNDWGQDEVQAAGRTWVHGLAGKIRRSAPEITDA